MFDTDIALNWMKNQNCPVEDKVIHWKSVYLHFRVCRSIMEGLVTIEFPWLLPLKTAVPTMARKLNIAP